MLFLYIFRFHPPKSFDLSFRSVIPTLEYGQGGPYNIPNDIVFACDNIGEPSTPASCLDPYAFAGVSGTVKGMIRYLKNDISYRFSSGRHLRSALIRYAECNSEIVYIDTKFESFSRPGLLKTVHIEALLDIMFDEAGRYWTDRVANHVGIIKTGIEHLYKASHAIAVEYRKMPPLSELEAFLEHSRLFSVQDPSYEQKLQATFDALNPLLHQGFWIVLFESLRSLFDVLIPTQFIWMPIYVMFMMEKYAHQFSNELELRCYRRIVLSIKEYALWHSGDPFRMDVLSVKSAASSLLKEIGNTQGAVEWLASSLNHA